MCICFLFSKDKFHQQNMMQVTWGSDEVINNYLKDQKEPHNFYKFRKFDDSLLEGNNQCLSLSPDVLSNGIKRLIATNDTVHGISVPLTNATKYNDVVKALDVCFQLQDENTAFIIYQNKLFIWRTKQKIIPKLPGFICGTPFAQMRQMDSAVTKASSATIFSFTREFWPSILGFVLMLCFTLFKKRMQFLDNIY